VRPAPACPLASRGSALRRAGLQPCRVPLLHHGWPVELHSQAAADRLAEAVAQALGCEPWPNLGPLCRQGALQALRWLRSRPDC
jgi:hypothetical protein